MYWIAIYNGYLKNLNYLLLPYLFYPPSWLTFQVLWLLHCGCLQSLNVLPLPPQVGNPFPVLQELVPSEPSTIKINTNNYILLTITGNLFTLYGGSKIGFWPLTRGRPQMSQMFPFLLLHLLSTILGGCHPPCCHCHTALADNPAPHPDLGNQIQTFVVAPYVLASLQNEGRLRWGESNFTRQSQGVITYLEGWRGREKEDKQWQKFRKPLQGTVRLKIGIIKEKTDNLPGTGVLWILPSTELKPCYYY